MLLGIFPSSGHSPSLLTRAAGDCASELFWQRAQRSRSAMRFPIESAAARAQGRPPPVLVAYPLPG